MVAAMNNLLASPPFNDARPLLENICESIRSASMVHIHAPADAVGVLGLAFIEAACLDLGLPYARRFMPPHRTLPRDEQQFNETIQQFTEVARSCMEGANAPSTAVKSSPGSEATKKEAKGDHPKKFRISDYAETELILVRGSRSCRYSDLESIHF